MNAHRVIWRKERISARRHLTRWQWLIGRGLSALISVGMLLSESSAFAGAIPLLAISIQNEGSVSLSPPWLVTVIHRIPVRDLLESLRRQGLQASALDGLARSPHITNITTGLVVDERGRILVRLMGAISDPRAVDVMVLARDGRVLRPTRIEYDDDTGYAVLEVPSLGVSPPTFVRKGTSWVQEAPVKILTPIPEMPRPNDPRSARAQPSERPALSEKSVPSSWRHLLPMKFALQAARLKIATALSSEATSTSSTLSLELLTADWSADGSVVITEKGEVLGIAEEHAPGAYLVRSTESLQALARELTRRAQQAARKAERRAESASVRAQRMGAQAERAAQAVRDAEIHRSARGWIGIRAANVTDLQERERAALSLTPEAAVIATEVIAGGPADRAGMQTGDALLEYRGHKITSVNALAELIAQTPVGVLAPVTIWRKGEVRQLLIPVEERPSGLPGDPHLMPSALSRGSMGSAAPSLIAQMGLRVMDLTEQLADFFGVRQEGGVLVLEVTPNGPAAHAGVHAGDVITGIGPTPIRNRSDMLRALGALPAETVILRIIRQRQLLLLTLRLR